MSNLTLKMHKFLSLILVMLFSLPALATATEPVVIRGRIVDRDKNPIPYASAYIVTPEKPTSVIKGMSSDSQGKFALPAEKNKSYILNVTYVGYKEYSTRVRTDSTGVNVGDITMESGRYNIAEVTIKPPFQVTADKVIYNFENDPDRGKSSLFDMLEKMPMISLGPMGNIIVGSPGKTYKVLRKGREDALLDFQNIKFEDLIKKLPAMGFTTFEIWTVVPPKYDGYDYVINILPDPQQRLFGVAGTPEVRYDFNSGRLNTGLGGNGSADIFRFSGGVKYDNTNAPKTTNKTNTTFYATEDELESMYEQQGTRHNTANSWRANIAASLDISKRQFITLRANASFMDSENLRQTTTKKTAGEELILQSHSRNTNKYESDSWEIGAVYQLDFRKKSRTFNASYLYSSSPSLQRDHRYVDYTVGGDDERKISMDDVTGITHRIQFDYYDQFLSDKLKLNAQAGYLIKNYDSEGVWRDELTGMEDVDRYTRLVQNFDRIDGFINFSYNASRRLNMTANLAADYLPDPDATIATTGAFIEDIKQKELLINTSAKLFYRFAIAQPKKKGEREKSMDEMTPEEKIAYMIRQAMAGVSHKDVMNNASTVLPNSSIRLDYLYSQRRPGVTQMTNFIDEQDPLFIRRGNPRLQTESNHTFMLMFSSWFIRSLMIQYSFSNDNIVSQTRREEERIVQSYYNAGKKRGFLVSLSHSVFKERITLSSSFNNNYIDYGDGNWSRQRKLEIGMQYNFRLFNALNSGINLSYYKTFNSGAEKVDDIMPINLSMNIIWAPKILGKEVLVLLSFNDILKWNRQTETSTYMPDYRRVAGTRHRGIPISISIRTTLGKFKVKPVRSSKSTPSVTGFSTDKE